ncbi:MAG: hypothetical protein AUK32_00715 [Candidatus Aquicultor secundus]|uniref:hypothetical protein n=1 Tax=Candidatus Aquicultor secundus TaxID=1973895 RepID=UPI00090EF678|nr:hypothetical protein [Candidatus Aquicultor secundus]OIO88752.1 MAG: hypothetical protein AUK32_00715 [Candidatus Aquicultor secundus]PIU26795.1 MAG: hypothetical protein COT10_06835 [Candidatus Aquicultor secundus]PIY41032.1 MAG: hypothetical protein COZ03_03000 [Candidatus Aquicultor secundus]PJB77651.1 MAG: hypothetical protein CO091_06460 [Candidatus Aquicultor secundus]
MRRKKPIEPTPTLEGKDAERFYKGLKNAKYSEEKEAQLSHAREIAKAMRKNWKTPAVGR